MNRLHHSLIALLVALTTWSATAQTTYRVEDVPNVQLIDYTRFVSDPNDSIDQADEAALNQRIGYLRDSLDVEIAVVVLPAIDGDKYGSAREFANELFNTWGIGKKETDRGLLILLITNEDNREITFEVGYGLEGELTDGLCKLIQKRRMIPPMKEGRYGEGLLAGVEEVRKVLTKDSTLEAEKKRKTRNRILIWWLVGLFYYCFYLYEERKKAQYSVHIATMDRANRKANSLALGMGIFFFQIPAMLIYFLVKWIFRRQFVSQCYCPECGAMGRFKRVKKDQVREETLVKVYSVWCRTCHHTALLGIHRKKQPNRCPKCRSIGSFDLDTVNEMQLITLDVYHFACRSCGHIVEEKLPARVKEKQVPPDSGYYWGGSSDGDSSSSSGGSWGGGSSGGGGASSRF
ncbi:MAG: TPM domain-containing protein [Tannerella sp.]